MSVITQSVTVARTTRRPWVDDPLLIVSGAVATLLLMLAVFGAPLAPYSPNATDLLAAGQGPSAVHLLGTDSLGRDILSRAMHGAALSFAGPGVIVIVSATLGAGIGIFAAWRGGLADRSVGKVLDVMFAVPGILVAILAAAIFGAGFWAPVIALTLVCIPYFARVIRSAALRERRAIYVEALQLAGMSPWRICTVHILRNVSPLLVAQSTIAFGLALIDFGAVSFLGLGVQPPNAEWGLMISDGRAEILDGQFMQSITAGLLIVATVVSFNLLGSRLSARFGASR